jgi:hypothetical protein
VHQEFEGDPIIARFTFKPERAADFLDDGRLVTQIDCVTIEEVMQYTLEFADAITDASAIVNGKVVNLSDYGD